MDIHKPKPWHSLREFLKEYGIIVLGVLTALGFEQAVEAVHRHEIAEKARRDVREEAAINLAFLKARLRESPCIAQRLDEIGTLLQQTGAQPLGPRPIWVGRPLQLPAFTERWRAVTSSARTELFPSAEQGGFDNLYNIFQQFEDEEKLEQVAWTDLKLLERWQGPLDSAARVVVLRALEQARHSDYELRAIGFYALGIAHQGRLAANPRFGPLTGAPDAVCLPFNTPAETARRQLRDRVPDPD